MRKKEYCPWLPVVRLSHSSSRLYRPHVFLPDQKTLRECYRKVFINHYSFPAAASACPPFN